MTDTFRITVKAGVLRDGERPSLTYHKILTRPDGKQRLFSQMAYVNDTDLLARLRTQVQEGDELEVVVEQRLGGGISSELKDFCKIRSAVPERKGSARARAPRGAARP